MASQNEECAICLEPLDNEICYLTCTHLYHLDCLTGWINRNKQNRKPVTCPLCNSLFEINTIFYKNYYTNNTNNANIIEYITRNTGNDEPIYNLNNTDNNNSNQNTYNDNNQLEVPTNNEHHPIFIRKRKRKTKCCNIL